MSKHLIRNALLWGVGLSAGVYLGHTQTFQNLDLGTTGTDPVTAGSATVSGGTVTVTGGGSDIWNSSDAGHYYYTEVAGDFDVKVQIESLTGTHDWAKAELMVRKPDGVTGTPMGPDAFFAMMGTRAATQNKISPQWRATNAGGANWDDAVSRGPVNYPDEYVRITRVGGTLHGYSSTDGSSWRHHITIDTVADAAWNDFTGPLYVGLAVTSHDNTADVLATGVFKGLTFLTPTAPAITTQPQSASVIAGSPATFTVGFNQAAVSPLPTFEWKKNGAVVPGVTGPTYTIDRTPATDDGATITVTMSNASGSVTSTPVTLSVNDDNIPPTLDFVTGSLSFTQVKVRFSEPVTPATAQVANNYKIQGLTISSAVLSAAPNDDTVILTTTKQGEGASYTLVVNNIKDVAGNTIAADSSMAFKSHVWMPGYVLHKFWDNVTANTIAGLEADPRYPDNPTWISIEPAAEYPPNGGNEGGSNYGNTLEWWFSPPQNGEYVMYTCSDDPSDLYLSTDDDPANKVLVAQETAWSNPRQWVNTAGGSDLLAKNSYDNPNSMWPGLFPWIIELQASQKYYMFSIHTEGGGGDNVGATFTLVQDYVPGSTPADGTAPAFTGNAIGVYLDPNGATVDIVTPPANTTQQENRAATFMVDAVGSSAYGNTVTYQWQKTTPGGSTFSDIAGATSAEYTTPVLSLADTNTKYRVICTVPTLSVTSAEAVLTVVPDTFPPMVERAGALASRTGNTVDVGVVFDEPVTPASAQTVGNFTIAGGTVSAAKYWDGSPGVVLTVSGLTAGNVYTVDVKNIVDLKGNTMTSGSASFSIGSMNWDVVGAGEQGLGAAVLPVSNNGFDIYSDGVGEWAAYDEATFVYEELTGDFDKKLRVEFQDNSSQWARAGLIARDVPNFGVDRATQEGGEAGRYQKVHVNPVGPTLTGPGTNGNGAWEGNRRLNTGGQTSSAGGGGVPLYPNAWCRMQRVGQTITIYRSDDGITWTSLGSTTWPDAAETETPGSGATLPDTLYVGPEFSPENANITNEGDRGIWLAKIRDYSDTFAATPVVPFGIGLNFGADEPDSGNQGGMPSSAAAGAPGYVQANWNNLSGAAGTASNLVADKTGSVQSTGVAVEWNCPNTWSSTGRGEENNALGGYDRTLMLGYLDTGAATTTTVSITGIPADLTGAEGGYDVLVYLLGGVPGRGGAYGIRDSIGGTVIRDYVRAQGPTNPSAHSEATGDPAEWNEGTYVIFRGLTASSIVVEGTTENGNGLSGTPRAPINAVQLVPSGGGAPPEITAIVLNEDGTVTVEWMGGGTLMVAPTVTGDWSPVAGATSPYTFEPTEPALFIRIGQ
ncbi:MAG: Ig-like domain-containing protein [Verrucomicrobiales bacterium]|nr:Ig-like domain-containing protein [Verrucomicrobiales bacterium]